MLLGNVIVIIIIIIIIILPLKKYLEHQSKEGRAD
jgi:hypothetical protein